MSPDFRGNERSGPGEDQRSSDRSLLRMVAIGATNVLSVLVVLGVIWGAYTLLQSGGDGTRAQIPFKPTFLTDVRAGLVKSISSKGDSIEGTFTTKLRYPPDSRKAVPTTLFSTEVPAFWNTGQLSALLQSQNVRIQASPASHESSLIVKLLPWLIVAGALLMSAGILVAQTAGFFSSGARRVDHKKLDVTFEDVAGIDEARAELTEIVDFLRDPKRYGRLGGRVPHGVLLSGEPGTGKTLLARAVASEARAAFFSISASEFIEAVVGVGASRVRDLFDEARESTPAIIFIDELDSIGRSRLGSRLGGNDSEQEQTLNQILTEMDGFESSESVVVLAATNRPDVLDDALLRPGRFDRRVVVQAPDREGRAKILEVHTRSMPLADGVDLDALAASTPGMVGADLANLANEAALLAARKDKDQVDMSDFTDSLEKIMLGAPRGIVLSLTERERTAYHEAGHALVGMLTPAAYPLHKISIIPRGIALGVTITTPDSDRVSYSREELNAQIRVALGGRVAEELIFGTVTTGADSDLEALTSIAHQMVGRWGMSEVIGPLSLLRADHEELQDKEMFAGGHQMSEATQSLIDRETKRIVDDAHKDVRELLTEHRANLESLAQTLLKSETLGALDAYAAAGISGRHDMSLVDLI